MTSSDSTSKLMVHGEGDYTNSTRTDSVCLRNRGVQSSTTQAMRRPGPHGNTRGYAAPEKRRPGPKAPQSCAVARSFIIAMSLPCRRAVAGRARIRRSVSAAAPASFRLISNTAVKSKEKEKEKETAAVSYEEMRYGNPLALPRLPIPRLEDTMSRYLQVWIERVLFFKVVRCFRVPVPVPGVRQEDRRICTKKEKSAGCTACSCTHTVAGTAVAEGLRDFVKNSIKYPEKSTTAVHRP